MFLSYYTRFLEHCPQLQWIASAAMRQLPGGSRRMHTQQVVFSFLHQRQSDTACICC